MDREKRVSAKFDWIKIPKPFENGIQIPEP
jgi:hypothetical protein